MASLIFNSFMDDLSKGNVKSTDTYYGMLVTSSYAPDKDAHTKRSDVTNEVSGTGYAAGGQASALVVALDLAADKETWSFGDIAWAASTITARACVLFKHRGGLASADELVAYVDFGGNITSTASIFTFHETSPLIMQN